MSPPYPIQLLDSTGLRPRRATRGARWIWLCNVQGAAGYSWQRDPRRGRGVKVGPCFAPCVLLGRRRYTMPTIVEYSDQKLPANRSPPSNHLAPAGGCLLLPRHGMARCSPEECALGVPVPVLPTMWLYGPGDPARDPGCGPGGQPPRVAGPLVYAERPRVTPGPPGATEPLPRLQAHPRRGRAVHRSCDPRAGDAAMGWGPRETGSS